jgi:ammonium transporter, Amt family
MNEDREIVLIVDDEPGVSALQRRRLERAGFEVRNAETASAAMDQLQRGGVKLAVLDYRLSGEMNGLEFYAVMKQAGYDLPVILVTGYSQESTIVEALRAGVRDFVSKSPDYIEYLLQAVERLFQQLRTERRLAEAQARLAAVVNSSMDAIITTDAQGTIALFNAAAERMFGCTSAEALNQCIARFSPKMAELVENARSTMKTSEPTNPYEMQAMRRNGQRFLIETSLSSGHAANKAFYTFIVRDITQRQRIAAELQMAKEAAEAASVAKSTFLTNMSHELRTPMTAILGFTDLLLDEEPNVNLREALVVIKRNSKYLLDIINDLLDISKIEAGQLTIDQAPCSPRQLLTDIHALMLVRSQAKGLQLILRFTNSLPKFIYTDAMRLRQILINVVGNAIKFTESGDVRIVARSDTNRRLLHIDVVDTGIGMTDDEMAGLFRPFTQADGTSTRRFGGAGLGLTISKQLAVLLGGEITVRSKPGVGSTFQLTVPVTPLHADRPADAATGLQASGVLGDLMESKETQQPAPPSRSDQGKVLADQRILLVEDSPDSQRLISTVLAKSGATVTVVENGQLAVDAMLAINERGAAYDLVLMDMQMPVLDGYEATRRMRQAGATLPILALTAHAMKGDREKCFEAGCDDYITKPVDVAMLQRKLADWTGHRRAAVAIAD